MNDRQKISASKFLYDITKGILLVTVAGNLMQSQPNIYALITGSILSVFTYTVAYQLEK